MADPVHVTISPEQRGRVGRSGKPIEIRDEAGELVGLATGFVSAELLEMTRRALLRDPSEYLLTDEVRKKLGLSPE